MVRADRLHQLLGPGDAFQADLRYPVGLQLYLAVGDHGDDLLGVGDVQIIPQDLVYRLLVGWGVLVQVEQPGEVHEAVVRLLLDDTELLGDEDEPPSQEGGVKDGHPRQCLDGSRFYRADGVHHRIPVDMPGELQDDPVGVRGDTDGLPETCGEQGGVDLPEGLVNLAAEAAIDDRHPVGDLHGDQFIGGHLGLLVLSREVLFQYSGTSFVAGVVGEVPEPSHASYFHGDLEGDGYVGTYPIGDGSHLPRLLDEDLVLPHLDNAPRPSFGDEHGELLREGCDEALVQGTDYRSRPYVADEIGPLVGDHGDVVVEVAHSLLGAFEGGIVVEDHLDALQLF